MLNNLKRHIQKSGPWAVASEVKAVLTKHRKGAAAVEVFSLTPKKSPLGNVLVSYMTHAFSGKPIPYTHTAYWESRRMAETFADLGYAVDVINSADARDFHPRKPYSFFVGHRHNFDRIAKRVNDSCIKTLHCDVAHWLFHNTAGSSRLLDLQRRKGVTLPLLRVQEPNRAIEHADKATVLGNEFTIGTYAYAHKPVHRVLISTPAVYPWPADKQFDACRKTFLWFNSNGFVHKGLDLVLEAFAGMPDLHLIVCGPIEDQLEKEFKHTYYRELYETPNIHTANWVEDASKEFLEIARECVAVISASCSEGGGGSIISCMQAGLIPVVNYETSVDVHSFGVLLRDSSIECITDAVKKLAGVAPQQLQDNARQSWEFARANHTRERFAEEYRKFASVLTAESTDTVVHHGGTDLAGIMAGSSSSSKVSAHVR
jgi:glycosyltransferase involved in cell wall biosynthesis